MTRSSVLLTVHREYVILSSASLKGLCNDSLPFFFGSACQMDTECIGCSQLVYIITSANVWKHIPQSSIFFLCESTTLVENMLLLSYVLFFCAFWKDSIMWYDTEKFLFAIPCTGVTKTSSNKPSCSSINPTVGIMLRFQKLEWESSITEHLYHHPILS